MLNDQRLGCSLLHASPVLWALQRVRTQGKSNRGHNLRADFRIRIKTHEHEICGNVNKDNRLIFSWLKQDLLDGSVWLFWSIPIQINFKDARSLSQNVVQTLETELQARMQLSAPKLDFDSIKVFCSPKSYAVCQCDKSFDAPFSVLVADTHWWLVCLAIVFHTLWVFWY